MELQKYCMYHEKNNELFGIAIRGHRKANFPIGGVFRKEHLWWPIYEVDVSFMLYSQYCLAPFCKMADNVNQIGSLYGLGFESFR